jgi:hypothetical protein
MCRKYKGTNVRWECDEGIWTLDVIGLVRQRAERTQARRGRRRAGAHRHQAVTEVTSDSLTTGDAAR